MVRGGGGGGGGGTGMAEEMQVCMFRKRVRLNLTFIGSQKHKEKEKRKKKRSFEQGITVSHCRLTDSLTHSYRPPALTLAIPSALPPLLTPAPRPSFVHS